MDIFVFTGFFCQDFVVGKRAVQVLDDRLFGFLVHFRDKIMVLFIFVIMVLNLRDNTPGPWNLTPGTVAAAGVGGLVGLTVMTGLSAARAAGFESPDALLADFGTIEAIGDTLFRRWLLPFELVSALLTVAVIGAVVLSKKEL